MSKNRHHYVPKLYLRLFACAPRQIHLFNHRLGDVVLGASLRDQCYRHKFYGRTDDLEDAFGELETLVAPILQRIVRRAVPPAPGSGEHAALLTFVALQLHRTVAAAESVNETADQMVKAVFHDDPRLDGHDLSRIEIRSSDPIIESLSFAELFGSCITDLEMHVLTSDAKVLITSDNPVVKYNKYCEGVRYMGVLGGVSRGLILFLPISPHRVLVLYDAAVYKFGSRGSHTSAMTAADVEAINVLQLLNSVDNVYFSDALYSREVAALARAHAKKRPKTRLRTGEFVQEGDDTRSLIHSFEAAFNFTLDISALTVRKAARKIPLHERPHLYRRPPPIPEDLGGPDLPPGTRFIARR